MNEKTFKDWMIDQFDHTELEGLCRHGAVVGWSGLTYYHETIKLYDQHEEEIWDLLSDESESLGYSSVLDMIASFNGAKSVETGHTFKNLLVWYAAETVASHLIESHEDETDEQDNEAD